MILPLPIERGQYIRIGEYKIEEVLSYVSDNKKDYYGSNKKKDYDGYMVKMNSQRYLLFKTKGITCVKCGVKGQFFGLEKIKHQSNDTYHFNLYGIKDGVEILMTKDHIVPKSKGGRNNLKNYQVMCTHCNLRKSDQFEKYN